MGDPGAGPLRLVFITPGDRPAQATLRLVEQALDGGVTAVLLREEALPEAKLGWLAASVAERVQRTGARLLVHRSVGLALACGAHAVHTGYGGPTVGQLRASAPGLLVGRSCHWPVQDEDERADYVLLSPFRPTFRSHARPLLRPEQVARVCAHPGMGPVVALGGLNVADVAGLPDGLCGVAVLRAVADARDPRRAAAELRAAVDARWRPQPLLS